jgi:CubicO group peptidase (beta-lactamase class C family)
LTQGQGWSIDGMNALEHGTSRRGGAWEAVATHIREQAAAYCESTQVPGYLAGVYHDGNQTVVAHGVANALTGAPMGDDTGFLFGSVTKVLTTTLVLQQVERGAVDLDERVVGYLPDFKLTTSSAAEKIRVRNLLTHTNGIDADLFLPDARGRGALRVFVEGSGNTAGRSSGQTSTSATRTAE